MQEALPDCMPPNTCQHVYFPPGLQQCLSSGSLSVHSDVLPEFSSTAFQSALKRAHVSVMLIDIHRQARASPKLNSSPLCLSTARLLHRHHLVELNHTGLFSFSAPAVLRGRHLVWPSLDTRPTLTLRITWKLMCSASTFSPNISNIPSLHLICTSLPLNSLIGHIWYLALTPKSPKSPR